MSREKRYIEVQEQLAELQAEEREANRFAECRDRYRAKLAREGKLNAFKKTASLFSFPFKGHVFSDMFSTALSLILTFIFSVIGSFVLLGIILCAIVDFLYILLYGVFFPFACLYYAVFGPLRRRHFTRKIARAEKKLARYDLPTLRGRIAACERAMADIVSAEKAACEAERAHEPYVPRPTGVEQTEWYQNKVDDEYRRLMGLPPRDNSLPAYATDVTLDLHPGDY
ncbi:MAG: hypothetical protein IJ009_00985 [Clostridia bacterium]|nr:hypothetical protein [Clostridia bacterium]